MKFPTTALIMAFSTVAFSTTTLADDVAIKNDGGTYKIHTSKYDAIIEPDGCMTQFTVNGQNYLRTTSVPA